MTIIPVSLTFSPPLLFDLSAFSRETILSSHVPLFHVSITEPSLSPFFSPHTQPSLSLSIPVSLYLYVNTLSLSLVFLSTATLSHMFKVTYQSVNKETQSSEEHAQETTHSDDGVGECRNEKSY